MSIHIGFKLATEGHPPAEIVEQAVLAERAGFDSRTMPTGER